jgi:hypothetical protein
MQAPLPLADAADPRLAPAIARALKKTAVPPEWADTVRQLATGQTKASHLRCCGSGCRPCVQDVKAATVQVLVELRDGPPEPVAHSLTGLHLRARLRKRFGSG